MFRNYLLTAVRNLYRNKGNTTINVLGLTLGITCSLVLFLLIRYELSFNKHFADADRIYRVLTEERNDDGIHTSASLQFPFIKAFQTEFPDIVATYIENDIEPPSFYITKDGEEVRFEESSRNTAMVHPDYPKVFDHTWLAGDPEKALTEVNSMVLTRKMAMKYFGRLDVVGETINYDREANLKVTGVIEDYPNTTDLPIDVLISIATHKLYQGEEGESWGSISSSIKCYVKLPQGITQEDMEARLLGFDDKYSNRGNPENYKRLLQPLTEVHYATTMSNYAGRTVNRSDIWSIGVIGVILLVVACINFVNLNTALAMRRAKEVGIRKVLGSNRKLLFYQFMGETLLVTLVAVVLSLGTAELSLIKMREYLGYDLHIDLFGGTTTLVFLLIVFVAVLLLSGFYPAIIMSAYRPIVALRSRNNGETSTKFSLRKLLVAFQLMISQVLIICTILAVRQMDFFYNAPIGLDKESVLELQLPFEQPENELLFKSQAMKIPGVQNVTFSNTAAISNSIWAGGFRAEINGEWIRSHGHVKYVDSDFLATYGIELIAGENIIDRDSSKTFLINEQMVKKLGLSDANEAIGKALDVWGDRGFITGVVSNYHTESLHESVKGLIMTYGRGYGTAAIRFNTSDIGTMVDQLEPVYTSLFPERNFEPEFLDETVANFYDDEAKVSTLFQVAASVAIFIGCIGMIGLISYMANRKTKEVGIRKVLGASVANILLLFSRHFLVLTFTGFVLAAPVAYWLMINWLQNFEYSVGIGVGTFALALLASIMLVVLATGYRAYRSAVVNPAQSLRSE